MLKHHKLKVLGFLCAFPGFAQPLFAQTNFAEKEIFALHPKFGLLYNRHQTPFSSFAGVLDYCREYADKPSFTLSGFLAAEYPLFEGTHLGLGIGYVDRSTSLVSTTSYPARDTASGALFDKVYENEVTAKLAYLEIQPEIRTVVIDQLLSGPLRLVGALRLAMPLTAEYSQVDKAVSPEGLVFVTPEGRSRERAIASGQITSKSGLAFGLSAGVENMLRVGNNTYFTQQILFDYNINSVVSDATWRPWGIRAELGLRYSFVKTPPVIAPPPVIVETVPEKPASPPVKAPEPLLQYSIARVDATLQLGNDLVATPPIVNAVFFPQNSATLPSQYVLTADGNESFLDKGAVEAHRYLLRRIADIVRRNPRARIILEGATSGNDESGPALARKRAETVRDALVQMGVPANVLSVQASLLPRNPSNQDYTEGREENRRVDITLQNAPLQEYVARQQFAQVKGTIFGNARAENVGSATVTASCADTVVRFASSSELRIPFLCRVDAAQKSLSLKSSAASDKTGQVDANYELDLASLPQEQIALRVDDFMAILRFDYNSSELSVANRDLLRQLVEKVPDNAEIAISGTSDALGSEQRNAELSSARAKVTEDFIRSAAGNRLRITAGKGAAQFPENTPEGRFLNRSITVRIIQ